MSTVRPVALVGLFGVGNFGNDATLGAMLHALSERGVRNVVVVADTPERVRQDVGVASVPIAARRRAGGPFGPLVGKTQDALRALTIAGHAGALILPGTGAFEGVWVEAGGLPLTLCLMAVGALLRRRRLDVVAAGIDVAGSSLTRLLNGATLRMAASVSVRDEPSADAAMSLGLRRRPRVVPDQTFALPPVAPSPVPPSGDRPRVVVGVMDYAGRGVRRPVEARDRYLGGVAELVVRLLDEGCAVHLVPGAIPDIEPMRQVAARVAERVPGGALTVSAARTYGEAAAEMAGARAVTASRFHTVVGALAVGTPVVPFGYGPKHEALVARFGLPPGVDVDTFEPDDLAARVMDLVARHDEFTGRIREAGRQARAELASLYDELVAGLPYGAGVGAAREVPA
ncbi:MAG TPA: polysaccharide pyruvyl transferase family protein [Cellulomonas sp.]